MNVETHASDGTNIARVLYANQKAPDWRQSFHANRANFFALPDVDTDSAIMVYDDHQLMYSDPIVVAALASPPFFGDLGAVDDNHTGGYTEYATAKGQGGSNSKSQTFNLGGYVAFELGTGAGMFGESVKAAIEVEASYNHGWTWESEQRSMIEFEKGFYTDGGQDSVVIYAVPQDMYLYKLYSPKLQGNQIVYEESEVLVVVPYDPCYSVLPLDEYTKVRASYPELLPNIAGDVFKHTLGVPGSYPASAAGYRNALTSAAANNYAPGASGIRDTISMSQESSEGTVSVNQVGLKAGGGVEVKGNFVDVKLMIGVTLGYDDERGEATIDTSGVTYEGSVRGPLPATTNGDKYGFNWRLMEYQYQGLQDFPVVTYAVSNVRSPAGLPGDYGVLGTTEDTVTLYWEPSPEDTLTGNAIYNVYRVTTSSVSPTPVNSVVNPIDYDASQGIYTITQSGLNPQTQYRYVINATRASDSSSTSTYSAWIDAWTTPAGASVYFDPPPSDIELGTTSQLTATLNAAGFEVDSYEWQKKSATGNSWTPVSGTGFGPSRSGTNFSLTFNSPSSSFEGVYRLVVDYTQGLNTWTIVSDPATVTFSKMSSATEIDGTPNVDPMGFAELRARVTGAGPTPTGDVQFSVTHTTTGTTAHANGRVNALGIALAEVRLPVVGDYTVTATYRGNDLYNGSDSASKSFAKLRRFLGFEFLDPITGVPNGTAKTAGALGLPDQVTAITDDGNVLVPVTWDVSSSTYGPALVSQQTFTVSGQVALGDLQDAGMDVVPPTPYKSTSISVTVEASGTTTANRLLSITQPSAIVGLPNGTAAFAAALGLPDTVIMVTDDGDVPANVTWNVSYSPYDSNMLFEQNFDVYGHVTLPDGVTNPLDVALTAMVNVTVAADAGAATRLVTVTSAGTGASGSGSYIAGEAVTIDAGTAPAGQRFVEWTTEDVAEEFIANVRSQSTYFLMPNNDVTFTAVFEDALYSNSGTITGSDAPGGLEATLQLKDSSGASIGSPVTANTDGRYFIDNVPLGTGYTIAVTMAGYQPGTIAAFDVADHVDGLDLVLQKTLTIDGTLNLAVAAATGQLTASVTGGSGTYSYAWSVAGQGTTLNGTASGSTYTPAASELGKAITCTATKAGTAGELTASQTVYKVEVTASGATGTDAVSIAAPYGKLGDTIQLAYTLANAGSASNTLTYSGTATLPGQVSVPGSGTSSYAIAAGDAAANGVISMTAAFAHSDVPVVPVSSITVTGAGGATAITASGGTLQMSATVLPADATNNAVTWSVTSGTGSASISASGLLTAVSDGTVTVRATANDGSNTEGTLVITITGQTANYQLTVNSGTGSGAYAAGTPVEITADAPASGMVFDTWTGGNGGTFTNANNATTTFTMPANNATVTATYKPDTPAPVLVTAISITGGTAITAKDGTLQLTANVTPAGATDKSVTWSIDAGAAAASVDAGGLVTALADGTVTVRATANDGSGVFGTTDITITGQTTTYQLTVSSGIGAGSFASGTPVAITANAPPLGMIFDTWTGGNGGVFDNANNATTTFTMPANNATVTATYKPTMPAIVLVTGITVSGGTAITAKDGTLQLTADVTPANATNKSVSWTVVSGAAAASVDAGGLVTALADGTVTVRVTAMDGSAVYQDTTITVTGQTATYVLTVNSGTGSGSYAAGTPVVITADAPASGLVFDAWTGGNGGAMANANSATTSFTMPANDATVTATYKPATPGTVPVTGISIGGGTTITTLGGTLVLFVDITPADATDKAVEWTIVSGGAFASVDAGGLVTALADGTVTVRATALDGSATYQDHTITITGQTANFQLTVNSGTGSGDYAAGTPVVITANAPPADMVFDTWTGGNGGTFANANNATTSFTMPGNNATVTATYKAAPVVPVPVTGISITGGAAISINGGTLQLTANVTPADATNQAVSWTVVSGAGFASVDAAGLVTAIANGTVTIRATALDGSAIYQDTTITVTGRITTYQLTVNSGTGSGSYAAGTPVAITANAPAAGMVFDRWTGVGGGTFALATSSTTTFTMPANDAAATATYKPATPGTVPVTGIAITGGTAISVDGGTLQLAANVAPADATNKAVSWTLISGAAFASVDVGGLVTAIANGTVTIRAAALDGSGTYQDVTITITGQTGGVGPPPVTYRVLEHFGTWPGSGGAKARVDADHGKFVRLVKAGVEVDPKHYAVTQGSTVITFNEAYLKTLSAGTHVYQAVFSDGTSESIVLTISAPTVPGNPVKSHSSLSFTGTETASATAILAVMLVAVGLIMVMVRRRHRL
ncbi:MAG: Ig-like domain-containing protein [Micrococcales bacterium]|nr:Ig-like domain-containing protein [Micrococcales bacterium]